MQTLFGRGEFAAALWPVELIAETDVVDPDEGSGDDLNGLLPRGVNYRTGATTEMVARRWNQTSVSVRRTRDNLPPDLLLEELQNLSRLRHPGNNVLCNLISVLTRLINFSGLILLMGVGPTQNGENVQLIYEPVYYGSLHHRLQIDAAAQEARHLGPSLRSPRFPLLETAPPLLHLVPGRPHGLVQLCQARQL